MTTVETAAVGAQDSLIAPLRARAEAYSKATARATIQAAPPLLTALKFRPFSRLLDLACGPGYLAGAATALGATTLGLDISSAMVAVARARNPQTEFKIGDAAEIPEPDGRYDRVACNFGMPHFEQPQKVIAEAFRVLKPGGRFAFTQWRDPSASSFFGAVDEVLQAVGPDSGVAPLSSDIFRLGAPEAASEAMTAAGFHEVDVAQLPIDYDAPEGDFLALLDDLALPLTVPRADAEALQPLRDKLNARMSAFKRDGRYRIPMPAALVAGRKPL